MCRDTAVSLGTARRGQTRLAGLEARACVQEWEAVLVPHCRSHIRQAGGLEFVLNQWFPKCGPGLGTARPFQGIGEIKTIFVIRLSELPWVCALFSVLMFVLVAQKQWWVKLPGPQRRSRQGPQHKLVAVVLFTPYSQQQQMQQKVFIF